MSQLRKICKPTPTKHTICNMDCVDNMPHETPTVPTSTYTRQSTSIDFGEIDILVVEKEASVDMLDEIMVF